MRLHFTHFHSQSPPPLLSHDFCHECENLLCWCHLQILFEHCTRRRSNQGRVHDFYRRDVSHQNAVLRESLIALKPCFVRLSWSRVLFVCNLCMQSLSVSLQLEKSFCTLFFTCDSCDFPKHDRTNIADILSTFRDINDVSQQGGKG